jgi:hypothetical protein
MSQVNPTRCAIHTAEAAEYIGLSRARLAKLRWAGGGPKFIRVGRTVLYKVAELESWLDANTRQSTSSPKSDAVNSS